SFTIRLTPAQRQTLRAWQRSTALPAGVSRRARIILLRADGVTITDIAATVGMSRQRVYKWVLRVLQEGLEGLHSKGFPGETAKFLAVRDLQRQSGLFNRKGVLLNFGIMRR